MFVRALHGLSCNTVGQGRTLTGLTYGNDAECRRCGRTHADIDRSRIAVETDRTEFMASRIAERVGAGAESKKRKNGAPSVPVVAKQEGMVGVLIAADGRMAVAVSGGGSRKDTAVQAAATALYPTLEFAGNIAGAIPTVGGQPINAAELVDSTGVGMTSAPGHCAGPKLIAHAIANRWPRPYAMTETWAAKKHDATSKFAKSEPIESCNTCCRLVPLMLCG